MLLLLLLLLHRHHHLGHEMLRVLALQKKYQIVTSRATKAPAARASAGGVHSQTAMVIPSQVAVRTHWSLSIVAKT